MGKMAPGGPIQLTLVMLLALLGCQQASAEGTSTQNRSQDPGGRAQIYPPTPPYSSRLTTTIPSAQQSPYPYDLSTGPAPIQATNLPATSALPTDLGASSTRPMTPSRTTAQRTTDLTPMVPSQMTGDVPVDSLRTTLVPLILSTTGLPEGMTAPSRTPQRVQMTFNNRYSDLGVNEYDAYGNRMAAQAQLVQACEVTTDRITDVYVLPNATGYLVLRFSIQQGYPRYISEAVEKLKEKAPTSSFMRLNGKSLELTSMVFWTDDGPCLVDRCMNGGQCNVTLSGSYECQCSPGHGGSQCEDVVKPPNLALLALLVLLIIPIAGAVAVGFYFGLRRQQKQRLKKAFDLRDVRTIGPKSMLSLPHEPGMRNEMYDTRSFALAFTDTSFSKTSTPPSSSEDDLMSRMG